MRDYLLLHINGKRFEIRGADAFLSLSDFLRYRARLTGTKVVCAEGDCASCTVLIGRISSGGRLAYSTVASCIQFLFQLDCTHIVTIEGLKYDGELNPVQQAMISQHGAQCGFCTPGFVVSLHAMLQSKETIDACALQRGLTGNLCRCTGYEPILRAALATERSRLRGIDDLFAPDALVSDFERHDKESVEIANGAAHFLKPVSLDEALRFRAGHTGCAIVAGGTDYGVQVNKGLRSTGAVLSTASLAGFAEQTVNDGVWSIGAGVTLSALQASAAKHLPELSEMLERFGSPQIRNAGTLAGNIANGSSIGDTLPLLFVLNARLELAGSTGTRQVEINDFYTGYRQTIVRPDELISRVLIRLPAQDQIVRLYKVSKRRDLDISSFTAAFCLRQRDNTFAEFAIAYGGVGPTVLRLRRTEDAVAGQPYSYSTLANAARIAREEVAPISDVRGSADYRRVLTHNMLLKLASDLGLEPESGNGHSAAPADDGTTRVFDSTETRGMEAAR